MRYVSEAERRERLVRRHRLDGGCGGPEDVVRALVALHATDPATVYLSVLARSRACRLEDVADTLYARRSLVRWMAMRRTLFVFARDDIPTVQAAISTPLAAALRRRLLSRIERNGTEPAVRGDTGRWLSGVEGRVERALAARGSATGAELASEEAGLRTTIFARTPSEAPQNVTTSLLTLMSAEGRIVRAVPTGAWTSRHHRWEPVARWWPDGLPAVDPGRAQEVLARRWLDRFGPARAEDLQWWAGWSATVTRRVLSGLGVEEVDLHGSPGVALPGWDEDAPAEGPGPYAALLPALDPTPMGWKHREWFLGIDAALVFDRAGNIGPTLWWDGEIVGSWAVAPDGEVRTAVVADRGTEADLAIREAAGRLQAKLDGAVVRPAFPTPLERSLRGVSV